MVDFIVNDDEAGPDNTAALNAALTTPGTWITMPPGIIYFDGLVQPKADNIRISGAGENITYARFVSAGNCFQIGGGGFDANNCTFEDFTPEQASGSGYMFHHRQGRGLTIRRCGGQSYHGIGIRKFLKLGNQAAAVTGCANNGSGLVRVTAPGHAYANNDYVLVNRVEGTTEANGLWRVSGCTSSTFDLEGSSFANTYASGGVTCHHALVCVLSEMQSITVAGGVGIDVYSYAGELQRLGVVIENQDFTSGAPTTGTRGIHHHPGNAYDRFDGRYGRGVFGCIQFDVNDHIENTRVTNMQEARNGLDLAKTHCLWWQFDDPDDTGGGVELFNIDGAQGGVGYGGNGSAFRFDASEGVINCGAARSLQAFSSVTCIEIVGNESEVTFAEVAMSAGGILTAASGSRDFINIAGGVRSLNLEGVTAWSKFLGNSRDVVRLEDSVPADAVAIGLVQGENFAGKLINDVSGAAQALQRRKEIGGALLGAMNDNTVENVQMADGDFGTFLLRTSGVEWAIVAFDFVGTPGISIMEAHPDVEVTTGALSGTTGTDGKLTISVTTDFKIYVENRLGSTRVITSQSML